MWNHDEVIRHNVFAYNRDAQVWGWFDREDERHWPRGDADRRAAGKGPRRSRWKVSAS